MEGERMLNDFINERVIIEYAGLIAKKLDRYGEIIHDHEWTNGPNVLRNKTYLYNNKIYEVTRENGSIIYICFGGELYE